MRIILAVLLLVSTAAIGQTLNPYGGQPSQRDEYAARLRQEAEQQRRQYEMEQERQRQDAQRQQFNQQMGGLPTQGNPYSVKRGY